MTTSERIVLGPSLARAQPDPKAQFGSSPLVGPAAIAFVILLLTASVLAVAPEEARGVLDIINLIAPALLAIVLLLLAGLLFAREPLLIWSPLPWFLVACAVYYGGGGLIEYIGNEESIEYIKEYYGFTAFEAFRTNLVTIVGIATVLGAFIITDLFLHHARRRPPAIAVSGYDLAYLKIAAIALLSIGMLTKYTVALPYTFGVADYTLPGAIGYLSESTSLALLIVCLLALQVGGIWVLTALILFSQEVFINTLTFAKIDVMITFLMPIIAWFAISGRMRVLICGVLLMMASYAIYGPLVSYGRETLILETGRHDIATFDYRLEIVSRYLGTGSEGGDAPTARQGWLVRLSYMNAGAFAVSRYDDGQPGDSMSHVLWTLVPRLVWPDKPMMTETGREFNILVTGNSRSFSAPGIFAEAYWNGGWFAVIGCMSYVGFLFRILTGYARGMMSGGRVVFLPVVFIGIQMGLRPDGWLVQEYVGMAVIAVYLHCALYILHRLLVGVASIRWN